MDKVKITILVDGISAIGVHNGVVRIQFFKLTPSGKAEDVLELQIPENQVKNILDGITKAIR